MYICLALYYFVRPISLRSFVSRYYPGMCSLEVSCSCIINIDESFVFSIWYVFCLIPMNFMTIPHSLIGLFVSRCYLGEWSCAMNLVNTKLMYSYLICIVSDTYIFCMTHLLEVFYKSMLLMVRTNLSILTIRPVARKGYGSIAHEAKPNGLLTRGP